ncbi:MAG TPA: hybrid sensor histidine kinase/response regulator [Spirochaetes bacterium]|nr:hybrid sensor histidine kinase/response regulator [Spirochaetota bacterium]
MMNNNKNSKILIVDDTPKNIQVLGKTLEQKDYEIIVAQDGLQALKVVEKTLPDLILLDIMMPKMDGFETCKRLKDNPKTKEIPIIFLTAKIEIDDLVKGFDLGAVDYITKPFNSKELLRRVETHLELKRKSESLEWSNQNNRELIHILCHDLTNPIGFIEGVLQLTDQDPFIFQEMKKSLWTAVKNSINIIDQVRKMQALTEGKYELDLNLVPLKLFIQESMEILKPKLIAKNLELVIDIDDHLEVMVERTSFSNSVINNLLTNAIKFSYPNTKIYMSAIHKTDQVTLSIKDEGMGMPKGLLKDLFKMNKSTTRPGTVGEKGTGFGMPLVYRFVNAYGGGIEIFSKEKSHDSKDHGTQVYITLKGGVQ